MSRAATRQVDLAIVTAWHTAMFGLGGYSGQLKGKVLADFLSGTSAPKRSAHADAIAFFHSLRARGAPVEITRH